MLGDRTITRNLLSSTTHLGGIRTFLEEDPFMKVVRHDQLDTMGPSETLSGTRPIKQTRPTRDQLNELDQLD